MKGEVSIYGVVYKFKTCYSEGENMWTSGNRYLDLKYKKKGQFFYTKISLARTDFLFSTNDGYEEENKRMDRFLTMSESELKMEIITAICLNERELELQAKRELEKDNKTKAFKHRFN